MPTKCSCSAVLAGRFDFGVPLEDIFSYEELHPRLKYLFCRAYEAYKLQDEDIHYILSHRQGSLSERLQLKDDLVLAYNYRLSHVSSGAYFWALRHFLGLLPIPLLPAYSRDVKFDWLSLADECKLYFKEHLYKQRCNLEYDIAQVLSLLPLQHLALLDVMIQFIRSLCARNKAKKPHKFDKRSLMVLSRYYCGALFSRPFRPGCSLKNKYLPLLVFMILRWQSVVEHCFYGGTQSCSLNIDYNRHYLKEVGCQTGDLLRHHDAYQLAFIEEELEESCEQNNETLYQTAPEFHFTSSLDQEEDWQSVMQETEKTVQKIEEGYIYDDYETFKREEFNQVGKKKLGGGAVLSSISKYVLPKTHQKCSTPNKSSSDSTNSYVKYPDVCDQSSVNSSLSGECSKKEPLGRLLFQGDSPASVPNEGSDENLPRGGGVRRRYLANTLRISLRFFRSMTPKRGKRIEGTVKYRRI